MASSSHSTRLSSNGSDRFVYSQERMVVGLTKFIITMGLPLKFGERPDFVEYVQKRLNPNFTPVKRATVINEANKQFSKLKRILHSYFASIRSKIAIACDVWENANRLKFVRVTAHWIDSGWVMHRRVINIRMLEWPMHDEDTCDKIKMCIDEWGIGDKIFSVTLDEVGYKECVREGLKNVLNPILDGNVFSVGCVCRILNSCVGDGWGLVSGLVHKIVCEISLIQLPDTYSHYEHFGKFCVKYGLEPKRLMFDDARTWNSTCEMLKACLPYKVALTDFIETNWPGDDYLLSEQDWETMSVFCRFLDVFGEAVKYISANYSPSSSGVLLHLVDIAKLFSEYKGSGVCKEIISVMEKRFFKHFDRIPYLYCLAAIMDPRIKLSGCEYLLDSFYQFTDDVKVNVEEEKREISKLLHEMFNVYESQSSNKQPSSSGPTVSFGPSGFAWSLLSKKKEEQEFNELTFYLQSPHGNFDYKVKDFDILGWWKRHEIIYPALSIMARDLLTTPVSTLAPDCAFVLNESGKILNETEYMLREERMEIYTCLRDWFHAETRTQGERQKYEDESYGDESEDQFIALHKEFKRSRNFR